jgi:NAD-dependent deacetylase
MRRAARLAEVAPRSRYPRVVVLTGAGISAAAGIPTFRGPDGRWTLSPQLEDAMHGDRVPGNIAALWQVWGSVLAQAERVGPTAAHRALAASGATVITQNVDSLHLAAGTRSVLELHGSAARARCLNSTRSWTAPVTSLGLDSADRIGCHVVGAVIGSDGLPRCPDCGELMRPDVVLFGESLPAEALRSSLQALEKCDLFVAIGTSGVVAPAASFAAIAARAGALCVNVALDPPTQSNPAFAATVLGDAQEELPRWLES